MYQGMRREFLRRMFSEMGGSNWRDHASHAGWHHWHGDCGDEPTPQERLARLETYQRDLEEQVADVATRIKRLREEMADSDSA